MLHTEFRRNRPTGSEEDDFQKAFTIHWHGSHLRHVTSSPGESVALASLILTTEHEIGHETPTPINIKK